MGLGLQTGGAGGDRTPFIKYDARAGRMFRVDRSEKGGEWVTDSVDVTNGFSFVPDLANTKVGWINFSDQGPQKVLVRLGDTMPARPSGTNAKGKAAFQQAFEILAALPAGIGGGIREFASTAGCVIDAVSELHDVFSASPESKTGKLPVVVLESAVPVKSGQSTNYKPVFRITGWIDRPPSLPAAPAQNGFAGASQTPPATGSTQAAPPPPKAAPQPETVGADSFG